MNDVDNQSKSAIDSRVPPAIDEEQPSPVKVNDLNVDIGQNASPSHPNDP